MVQHNLCNKKTTTTNYCIRPLKIYRQTS